MGLTWKTACLVFLFILISTLYAESPPEPQLIQHGSASTMRGSPIDEEIPLDDGLFFFEELFITEEAFFFEALMGNGHFPGNEASLTEKIFNNEEPFLIEEILSDEDYLLEDYLLNEKAMLAEEDFFDEDAFFFEAPPLVFEVPTFEMRSLATIFPNLFPRQRIMAMSNEGLRHYFTKDESPMLIPNPNLGIDLLGGIMKKNPSHIIEALVVMPYNEMELDLLDIYNAVGRIEKLKDYPASLNGQDFYVFTESTRIESASKRRAVPDPLPAATLPFSQTMYLRLKEINFGNLFIRADISISMHGITYSITNFTDVRYFLVPIVKAERFATIIYLEPVKEGILIYSLCGFYIPGFIADKLNLTPNINRRIGILIDWITDGLKGQEGTAKNE